ncbi:MAG: FtsQ-type POTRA domain-containing protein [Candidatus Auribacter fodinae]|uniref:FtsQ-type POTRA domain-containing protein n=1 Tax=Candidatus Auribacter fodinae TaxID=2093366 RepID=A0A3A4R5Q3_9BACT|nr:MAG: FtsQ-type POTRA domain-containing protein [Candidatus Auribacter fodinae]
MTMRNENRFQRNTSKKRIRYNRYYVNVRQNRQSASFRGIVKGLLQIGLLGGVLVGLYFLGVEIYRYVSTDPYFEIKKISIENNISVDDREILDTLGIRTGQNIFSLSIEGCRKQLVCFPNIRDIKIKKRLPDEIFIRVYERTPMFQLYNGAYFYVDKDGYVMAKMSREPDSSLPVVTGLDLPVVDFGTCLSLEPLELVSKAITAYQNNESLARIQIDSIDISDPEKVVFITREGGSITLGSNDFEYRLKKLDKILIDLYNRNLCFASIDLRFENVPVVVK